MTEVSSILFRHSWPHDPLFYLCKLTARLTDNFTAGIFKFKNVALEIWSSVYFNSYTIYTKKKIKNKNKK